MTTAHALLGIVVVLFVISKQFAISFIPPRLTEDVTNEGR